MLSIASFLCAWILSPGGIQLVQHSPCTSGSQSLLAELADALQHCQRATLQALSWSLNVSAVCPKGSLLRTKPLARFSAAQCRACRRHDRGALRVFPRQPAAWTRWGGWTVSSSRGLARDDVALSQGARGARSGARLDEAFLFGDRMLRYNRKSTTLHRRVKPAGLGRPIRLQAWPTRSPPLCWPRRAKPPTPPYHLLGNYLFREQIWEESEGLLVAFFKAALIHP